MNKYKFFISPILVLSTFLLINFLLERIDLPNYGTWTGIRPLEKKLRLFEKFSKDGEVDAVVLGSSIADFGFSAEQYSNLMTNHRGRSWRAFNFSTGGAELSTLPVLYRILLTITKPKEIILVFPSQWKRPSKLYSYSPDYILKTASIGAALKSSNSLKIAKIFWTQPIVDKAAALRDVVIFGKYQHLIQEGMDAYELNYYGDRISFTATKDFAQLSSLRHTYEENIRPYVEIKTEHLAQKKMAFFFPEIDIQAIKELKHLAAKNGTKITLIAHGSAATLTGESNKNEYYKLARKQYFEVLAKALGANLIYMLDQLVIPKYGVMEDTHLNHYGAKQLSTNAFYASIGKTHYKKFINQSNATIMSINKQDDTFNSWSAVVIRESGEKSKNLHVRFVNSIAVPSFPNTDLYLALRLPNGTDLVAPAKKIGISTYEAEYPSLKTHKEPSIFVLRILYGIKPGLKAIASPLAEYNWKKNSDA